LLRRLHAKLAARNLDAAVEVIEEETELRVAGVAAERDDLAGELATTRSRLANVERERDHLARTVARRDV
jgi:hypothetical protein